MMMNRTVPANRWTPQNTGHAVGILLLFSLCLTTAGCGQESQTTSSLVSWQDPVRVARGNGIRGPWRMNRSNFQYVDDPSARVTETGHVVFAWVDQARQNIFLQRFDRNHRPEFPSPVNVSTSPDTFSWFPDLVVTETNPDHVYVLWQEIVFSGGSHGGEAFFARSTDGGRSFDEPINLSTSEAGDGKGRLTEDRWDNGSLDLEQGPNGTLYAAWTEYEGRLWLRWSTDDGQTFSPAMLLSGGEGKPPARGPSIAVPEPGRVLVAWTQGETPTADIHLRSVSPEQRNTSKIHIVHRTEGLSDSPKITTGPDGMIHLAYGERPRTTRNSNHVRYTRSTDGGHTFQQPIRLAGPESPGYTGSGYPDLGMDDRGRVVVTWEIFGEESIGDLPARIGVAVSRDGGNSFTDPAVVPGTRTPDGGFNGSQQGRLMGKLDVSPNSDLVVVNSSFIPDHRSTVLFVSGSINGQ